MPKKYIKLGTIKKKRGLQLYEYLFNYGLLCNGTTDIFVLNHPQKRKKTLNCATCTCDGLPHMSHCPLYGIEIG